MLCEAPVSGFRGCELWSKQLQPPGFAFGDILDAQPGWILGISGSVRKGSWSHLRPFSPHCLTLGRVLCLFCDSLVLTTTWWQNTQKFVLFSWFYSDLNITKCDKVKRCKSRDIELFITLFRTIEHSFSPASSVIEHKFTFWQELKAIWSTDAHTASEWDIY